ncbi:methyltransferase domain-containing protein [Candidatus Woesearchaeota archaeon]|nr:methyltransferase domain-containing protein [Candidatus Woesearchaeota archaeon]
MIKKILFDKKNRKYYWRNGDLSTSLGTIKEKDMSNNEAISSTNQIFRIFTANFLDSLEKIKTGPATTNLKDIGAILSYSGIDKNSIVAEAGTGSGFLTSMLSRFVKRVDSYEKNEDFFNLSRKNIENLGIKNVKFFNKDISELKGKYDLIVLDLLDPWNYDLRKNLKEGCYLVSYLPNITQVRALVKESKLYHEKTIEIIEREWFVDERLRPKNTRLGHSAFLVFLRK